MIVNLSLSYFLNLPQLLLLLHVVVVIVIIRQHHGGCFVLIPEAEAANDIFHLSLPSGKVWASAISIVFSDLRGPSNPQRLSAYFLRVSSPMATLPLVLHGFSAPVFTSFR